MRARAPRTPKNGIDVPAAHVFRGIKEHSRAETLLDCRDDVVCDRENRAPCARDFTAARREVEPKAGERAQTKEDVGYAAVRTDDVYIYLRFQ